MATTVKATTTTILRDSLNGTSGQPVEEEQNMNKETEEPDKGDKNQASTETLSSSANNTNGAASLFKSFSKKKKPPTRKARRVKNSDDGDKEDEDDDEAYSRIEQTKKKQRLLQSIQVKHGLDASAMMTMSAGSNSVLPTTTTAGTTTANQNNNKTLTGTTVTGTSNFTSALKYSNSATSTMTVWELKHQQAMQEFIDQQLSNTLSTATNNEGGDATGEDTKSSSSASLAGANAAPTKNSKLDDGDVGAGGAVLGGTGIAEVALPLSSRLATVQETQQQLLEKQQQHRGAGPRQHTPADSAVRSSAAAVRPLSTATSAANTYPSSLDMLPSTLPSSYSHQFLGQRGAGNASTSLASGSTSQDAATPAVDEDRIGFAAARQQQQQTGGQRYRPESSSSASSHGPSSQQQSSARRPHQQHASDDRVWKQFMTRQRDQQQGGRR